MKLLLIFIFISILFSCKGPLWYGQESRSMEEENGDITITIENIFYDPYILWLEYLETLED